MSNGNVTWYPGQWQHPPELWLKDVWLYLSKYCDGPGELEAFCGIPLIPIYTTSTMNQRIENSVTLARIQNPSTLVLSCYNHDHLETPAIETLRAFGVIVLENLPEFVVSHRSLVPNFINPPSPRGVLTACLIVMQNNPDCISLDVRPLRKLFSHILPTETDIDFLKILKLFDTCPTPLHGIPSRPVAHMEVQLAAPMNDLPPINWCSEMIDVRDNSSRTLAQWLGSVPMKHADLVKMMLGDALEGKYSNEEIDKLVKYSIDRFSLFGEAIVKIKYLLTKLPFVTCPNDTKKRPGEIFDAQDSRISEMLLCEPEKFPKEGSQYANPNFLLHLRDLGLKGKKDVGPSDIHNSARIVNQISDVEKATTKSKAILQHLQENQFLLESTIGSTPLFQHLYSIPWIPVVRDWPETYPTSLRMDCHFSFACPGEVASVRYRSLVGCFKALVDDQKQPDISNCFNWNRIPSLEDVITQLKNVISLYNEEEKNTYVIIIKAIYQYLATQNVSDVMEVLEKEQILRWMWNGNGFSSIDEVVEHHDWLDLKPYLYPLPLETKEFASFFLDCGMKRECDSHLFLDILRRIKERHGKCSLKLQDDRHEVRRDLHFCIEILDELKPKDGETLDSETRAKLFIPVDVDGDTNLKLALIEECTYCDMGWLQTGHDVSDIDETEDEKIKFIHHSIPTSTAEALNVPTLMSRILDAEELEMGESFGQSESLLDRLKGLLQGYTDGLSVPKELIQNADDAGATEVRFLYDERTNSNAKTNLIDEGMKECQGPALWSYNDASFTDEDFQNVVKLNAATKEKDTGKIGRFGLGFNSVYNLTDVPSFVSGNSIVILDPHTTYLGKAIRDRSKPGIRLDSRKKRFSKLHNQFKPYNGIFGCDLSPRNKDKSYNGTLFRFPLRTAIQSMQSKISNLCYDESQVKHLLRIMLNGAESLLLFTQNVLTVRVYHLREKDPDPSQPIELFSISKSCEDVIHRLQCEVALSNQAQKLDNLQKDLVKQSSILKASTLLINTSTPSSSEVLMRSSLVIRSSFTLSECGKEFLSVDAEQNATTENFWLIHSCMAGEDFSQSWNPKS